MAKKIKVGKKYIITEDGGAYHKGTVVWAVNNFHNDGHSTAFTDKGNGYTDTDQLDWSDWYFIQNTDVKRVKEAKTPKSLVKVDVVNGQYTITLNQVQAEFFLAAIGDLSASSDKVVIKEFAGFAGVPKEKLDSFGESSYGQLFNTTLRQKLHTAVVSKYLTDSE